MTATDELRRLLDGRGVEHVDAEDGHTQHTWWSDGDHEICASNSGERLAVYNLTPEQAVEATLGSDLEAENEKLRELVRHMYTCLEHYEPGDTISCKQCPYDNETWGCDYERLMAELGIEVDV